MSSKWAEIGATPQADWGEGRDNLTVSVDGRPAMAFSVFYDLSFLGRTTTGSVRVMDLRPFPPDGALRVRVDEVLDASWGARWLLADKAHATMPLDLARCVVDFLQPSLKVSFIRGSSCTAPAAVAAWGPHQGPGSTRAVPVAY